jgi:hypothetical protein
MGVSRPLFRLSLPTPTFKFQWESAIAHHIYVSWELLGILFLFLSYLNKIFHLTVCTGNTKIFGQSSPKLPVFAQKYLINILAMLYFPFE